MKAQCEGLISSVRAHAETNKPADTIKLINMNSLRAPVKRTEKWLQQAIFQFHTLKIEKL